MNSATLACWLAASSRAASAGLPCAKPDAERSRAVGFAVTAADGGDTVLEWFASQSLRAAAADEQVRGIAYGHAVLAHGRGTPRSQQHRIPSAGDPGLSVVMDRRAQRPRQRRPAPGPHHSRRQRTAPRRRVGKQQDPCRSRGTSGTRTRGARGQRTARERATLTADAPGPHIDATSLKRVNS